METSCEDQIDREQYWTAKVSVWWDMEYCQLPNDLEPNFIAMNIKSALIRTNYIGPISFFAYGDTTRIPLTVQRALAATGVSLIHMSPGVRDGSPTTLFNDMMLWSTNNPAPANYLLISGDEYLSDFLLDLGMKRYNVLFARPWGAQSTSLVAAAKTVWLWTSLVVAGLPYHVFSPDPVADTGVNPMEAQYPTAKVLVWWDMEYCRVPNIFEARAIAKNIKSALVRMNYSGPVSIFAYGDTTRMPFTVLSALSSTGVSIVHMLPGVKDGRCTKLSGDMLVWSMDNPTPANYLLISGDGDLAVTLLELGMERNNVILALPEPAASTSLVAAAKSVWLWSSLEVGGPPSSVFSPAMETLCEDCVADQIDSGVNPTEAQYWTAKVSVWWDMEYCQVCDVLEARAIAKNIKSSLVHMNYRGPVSIFAYGDTTRIPLSVQQALSSTGVSLIPISLSRTRLVLDMLLWAKDNPTPANYLLISGDGDFGDVLHYLGMLRYNVLLALPQQAASEPLVAAAKTVWLWTTPISRGAPMTNALMIQQHAESENSKLPIAEREFDSNMSGQDFIILPPAGLRDQLVLISIVVSTLGSLEIGKLLPTETNITNYIRYGDVNHRNIDVKKALECAIERKIITKQILVEGVLTLYVGKHQKPWECLNPLGGKLKQQTKKKRWVKIQDFLTTDEGKLAMMATQCRFEAGMVLKKMCLKSLRLGVVFQILNMLIVHKKWIVRHYTGWQPLIITIPESNRSSS